MKKVMNRSKRINKMGLCALLLTTSIPITLTTSIQEVQAAGNPIIDIKDKSPFAYIRGSSYWPTSNIREWLNSDEGLNKVKYTNHPPDSSKMGSNAYDKDSGFLNEFSTSEKNGIAVTERRTFVHSNWGTGAKDGGTSNMSRYDGLIPSGFFHISSPDIDKVWQKLNYQTVNDKVFLLAPHELFEYVQKRGDSYKKGVTKEARKRFNINNASYHYATSSYNYSNSNDESIWYINSNGYPNHLKTSNPTGVVPALHLKPTYKLSNGKLAKDLNVGDLVTFGKFDGGAIQWRVINKTPEGNPLLWAEDILSVKRFSSPGDVIYRNSESVNFKTSDVSIKDDLKFTNGTADTTTPGIRIVDQGPLMKKQNGGFSLDIEGYDAESGIDYIILPNGNTVKGTKVNYYFSKNGRYHFTAVDKSGNHYGFEIPVGNITPPADVVIETSTDGWTNKDVTVDIKTTEANTSWSVDGPTEAEPSIKGIEFPNYTSYAGKRFRVSGKVRLISAVDDQYNALARISYNSIVPFGDNFKVQKKYPIIYSVPLKNLSKTAYTSFDEVYTIPGDYFDSLETFLSASHGKIDNGKYKLEWKDIKYELLDKEDFGIEKIILPNGKEIKDSQYIDTLKEEGTYVYRVLDSRGKTTEKTVNVKIDKINPDLLITGVPTSKTNQDVVLKVEGSDKDSGISRIKKPNGEWDDRSSFEYNIQQNGTYTFIAEDKAGNQTTKTVTISQIDKSDETKPSDLLIEPSNTNWTNKSVILNITGSSSIKQMILPDGTIVNGNKTTFEATDNGVYTFAGLNEDGVISEIGSYVVNNIDRKAKTGVIMPDDEKWRNQDIEVTIKIK